MSYSCLIFWSSQSFDSDLMTSSNSRVLRLFMAAAGRWLNFPGDDKAPPIYRHYPADTSSSSSSSSRVKRRSARERAGFSSICCQLTFFLNFSQTAVWNEAEQRSSLHFGGHQRPQEVPLTQWWTRRQDVPTPPVCCLIQAAGKWRTDLPFETGHNDCRHLWKPQPDSASQTRAAAQLWSQKDMDLVVQHFLLNLLTGQSQLTRLIKENSLRSRNTPQNTHQPH